MKSVEADQGFGLIESILVLVIMSLLLIAVLPSYHSLHRYYLIRESTFAIVSMLNRAKSESLTLRRRLYVHVIADEEHLKWRAALHGDADSRTFDALFIDAIAIAHGEGALISAIPSKVGFSYFNGRPVVAGHIKVAPVDVEEGVKVIYHHITGRIRVCSEERRRFGYEPC